MGCLWRTPNTYPTAGVRRGTATSSSTRPGTTSVRSASSSGGSEKVPHQWSSSGRPGASQDRSRAGRSPQTAPFPRLSPDPRRVRRHQLAPGRPRQGTPRSAPVRAARRLLASHRRAPSRANHVRSQGVAHRRTAPGPRDLLAAPVHPSTATPTGRRRRYAHPVPIAVTVGRTVSGRRAARFGSAADLVPQRDPPAGPMTARIAASLIARTSMSGSGQCIC